MRIFNRRPASISSGRAGVGRAWHRLADLRRNPEENFLGRIEANNNTTIVIIIIALGVVITIGFLAARKITSPIMQLKDSARSLAQGEMPRTIRDLSRVGELNALTQSFNTMAGQLQRMLNDLNHEINVRCKAEETLRRSEALLNKTQELTRTGGWEWDVGNQSMFWTEETYRIHDLLPEGMQAGSKDHLEKNLACYRPEDRSVLTEAFEKCAEGGESYSLSFPFTSAAGRRLWTRITGQAIRNEDGRVVKVSGVIQDITEQRLAEEALRASECRLRNVIQNMPIMLDALDTDNTIIVWNKECERVTGYSAEEVIGKKDAFELFYPEEGYWDGLKDQWAEKGDFNNWEIELTARDGSKKTVAWSNIAQAHPIPGWASWAIGVDVTRRRQAEEFLKKSIAEKEILLKEVHHRVKNNMQVITSLLNLQMATVDNRECREILIESQSRIQAMALVHELLYRNPDLSSISLNQYVSRLTEAMQDFFTIGHKVVPIIINLETMSIGINQASPLGLALNELVSNALKYAFPGIENGRIEIRGGAAGEWIEIVVADNGVGLPPDFDWRQTGTLGLRIVRTLIEDQLRGGIEVEVSGGTLFRLRLPAGPVAQPPDAG